MAHAKENNRILGRSESSAAQQRQRADYSSFTYSSAPHPDIVGRDYLQLDRERFGSKAEIGADAGARVHAGRSVADVVAPASAVSPAGGPRSKKTTSPSSSATVRRVRLTPPTQSAARKKAPPPGATTAARRVRLTPPPARSSAASEGQVRALDSSAGSMDALIDASNKLEQAVARLLAHPDDLAGDRGKEMLEAYVEFAREGGLGDLKTGSLPLAAAARVGDSAAVEQMLEHVFMDPSANDSEALRLASAGGHANVVRLLLDDGRSDPAALDGEALIEASRLGHLDVVELLLGDPRVTPAVRDYEAAGAAYDSGHVAVLRRLAEDVRASLPDRVATALSSYDIEDAIAQLLSKSSDAAADSGESGGDGSRQDEDGDSVRTARIGAPPIDASEYDEAEDITEMDE